MKNELINKQIDTSKIIGSSKKVQEQTLFFHDNRLINNITSDLCGSIDANQFYQSAVVQRKHPFRNASAKIIEEMQPGLFNRGNVSFLDRDKSHEELMAQLAKSGEITDPWTFSALVNKFCSDNGIQKNDIKYIIAKFANELKLGNCGEMATVAAVRLLEEIDDEVIYNYVVFTRLGGKEHEFVLSCKGNHFDRNRSHIGKFGDMGEEWVTDPWSGRTVSLEDYCNGNNHAGERIDVTEIKWRYCFFHEAKQKTDAKLSKFDKKIELQCDIYRNRLNYILECNGHDVEYYSRASHLNQYAMRKQDGTNWNLADGELKDTKPQMGVGIIKLWEKACSEFPDN